MAKPLPKHITELANRYGYEYHNTQNGITLFRKGDLTIGILRSKTNPELYSWSILDYSTGIAEHGSGDTLKLEANLTQ